MYYVKIDILTNLIGIKTFQYYLQKYHVTEIGDLVIQNITRKDKGNYKCKARQLENGVTDFQERVIKLKVQRKY